jgi:hypothetical protein
MKGSINFAKILGQGIKPQDLFYVERTGKKEYLDNFKRY